MTWWRFAAKAAERQLSRRRKVEPRINTLRTSPYYLLTTTLHHHTATLQVTQSAGEHSLRPNYSSFRPSLISSLHSIMYRQPFAPPPAQSPPLHHPVPQHVSTVPMMRSPPPPAPQQPQMAGYGNPYQPSPVQGGSGTYNPGFGGFINDPTAQMGFQVGKTAMAAGQEYMEQNVSIVH